MQKMRQTEQELLQSYGWVDRAAGIARIPLQRAMELVAEHGLPSGRTHPRHHATGGETPEEKR